MKNKSVAERFPKLWLILPLITSIAALLIAGYSMIKQPKMAYIDTNVLLEDYMGMQEAHKDYQVKADKWQASLDTLKMDIETRIKEYEENKPDLATKERQLTEELINTKRNQFIQYQKSISQKAQIEDQKLMEGVLNQTNTFIKKYGKEKGYSILFGANGSGGIVYGAQAVDITTEVLNGLNKEYERS